MSRRFRVYSSAFAKFSLSGLGVRRMLRRYSLNLWTLMTSFRSVTGVYVSAKAGNVSRLIQATNRRFIVCGLLLSAQAKAIATWCEGLREKADIAVLIWGFDETWQWQSSKSIGSNHFQRFMTAAQAKFHPRKQYKSLAQGSSRMVLKHAMVQTAELHVDEPAFHQTLYIPPRTALILQWVKSYRLQQLRMQLSLFQLNRPNLLNLSAGARIRPSRWDGPHFPKDSPPSFPGVYVRTHNAQRIAKACPE
jgi:hypothetical protein